MVDTSIVNTPAVTAIINSLWGFLSVLVVVIGVVVLVYVFLKHGRIKAHGIEISGALEDTTEDPQQLSPHFNCPHAHDISEVARRTAELGQEKAAGKLSTFNMQVKFYDEQSEKMMECLRHTMIHLINKRTGNKIPFISHPDYKIFENILGRIEPEIRIYMLARFTENHYATYDVEGQLKYIEDKVSFVMTRLTSKLNMYWCCQEITRADVYIKNKENLTEYAKTIENVFTEAFTLARACTEQEKALDLAYTMFLRGTVGRQI